MEARKTLHSQLRGDSMSSLINPTRGVRDDIRRKGGVPINHAQENYHKLKVMEREKKKELEMKEQRERLAKAIPENPRFSNVKSRVYDPVNKAKYNSQVSELADRLEDSRLSISAGSSPTSGKRPNTRGSSSSSSSLNDSKASNAVSPVLLNRRTRMGQVPTYLVNRKKEWAKKEEERLAALSDENKYPGMRLVKDDERQETLKILQSNLDKKTLELRSLPVASDSRLVNDRRNEIVNKLKEIEKAIDLFSQQKVYLVADS